MAQPLAAAVSPTDHDQSHQHGNIRALVLGCIGVVYGDIGTSPLYAFKEAVKASKEHGSAGPDAIIGMLSLMVWTLLLIVTLKYVLVLLRADNKGEGGTFALMALAQSVAKRSSRVILLLGIAGAAFFYGDAIITPAISVLSAVEGLNLVTPALEKWVVPISIAVLVGLFAVQSHGTERMAKYFGPIMVLWFILLMVGGLMHIGDDLRVLKAFNPFMGIIFIASHGILGLVVMGLVFLAVTGAEALYADLGHFGRRPIQIAWIWLVLPALMCNYFGQAALLLNDPSAIDSPFYRLYPSWALVPMVILATIATIIASQAVITGAFSITRQAISLGLLPRMDIRHTSESVAGQIYLPRVNMLLFVGVIIVVMLFGSSSRLAAAYGVSVTASMVIDSLMAFFVIWRCWKWPLWKAAVLMVPLVLIEQSFFIANMIKVLDGGWFPLAIATFLSLVMLTWHRGTRALSRATKSNEAELDWLVRKLESKPPHKVPGTAVFLTGDPTSAPTSLMHNLKHNRVLHERNIILNIRTLETPRVARHERVTVEKVSDGFTRVVARYGFMETPSVPKILDHCRKKGLNIEIGQTSFFLSRRSLKPTDKSELLRLEERLFIFLAGTAVDATEYFRIPSDRVVEVGTQVQV
ncbi:MAG: potassium transporter Kup [Hyphomicrobiaceae bacterium]|nr:potassium transporter Kup [Hyphomicrobiaceae bacterium]